MNWQGLLIGVVGVLLIIMAVRHTYGSFARALGMAAGTYIPATQAQGGAPNLGGGIKPTNM